MHYVKPQCLFILIVDVTERQCSKTPNVRSSAAESRLTNQLRPPSVGDSPLADNVLPRIRKEQQHRFHDNIMSTSEVNSSSSARTTWPYVTVTVVCCLQLTQLLYLIFAQSSSVRTRS